MTSRLFRSASLVVLFLAACQPVEEPNRKSRVTSYDAWSVFSETELEPRLCWVASTPFQGTAELKETFLTYSMKKREVSVIFDGADRPSPDGIMIIGEQELPMFFRGKQGWMKSARLDSLAAEAMRTAPDLTVKTGDVTISFLTRGFENAAREAGALCDTDPFTPPA